LLQPHQVTDEEGLVEAKRGTDLLTHFRRDGEGKVAGRIVGREIKQREDDEADDEQRRNGKG